MRKHFEHNKKVVFDALRAAGISGAWISYSGGGDCGQVDSVEFEPASARKENKTTSATVTLRETTSRFVSNEEGWQETDREAEQTLQQAVVQLAYDMLDAHVGGWENNEGGQGEVKLLVENDKIVLHHEQNVVHIESETYEG